MTFVKYYLILLFHKPLERQSLKLEGGRGKKMYEVLEYNFIFFHPTLNMLD